MEKMKMMKKKKKEKEQKNMEEEAATWASSTSAILARRAWHLLRMALLWVKRSGALRRRLMIDLRLIIDHLKSLGAAARHHRYDQLQHNYHRELSFHDGDTPTFHFKMHKPRLPASCFNDPPVVDFDDDDDDDNSTPYSIKTNHFLENEIIEEEDDDDEEEEEEDGEGIDGKAEEFIRKFYQQMKLQRQISLLKYNEMLRRGIN